MKRFFHSLLALFLLLLLVAPLLADTIRLKDGNVIQGQVVGFKDGQFTVLIGSGSKGRRSRTIVYVEDIESIEFDTARASANSDTSSSSEPPSQPMTQPSRPSATPEPVNTEPAAAPPTFFTIRVTVRADNANNGWTNSGLVVRRGQRLRITATGRVDLGKRGFSTPAGIPLAVDNDRLMRTEPMGALIGVIGDDNDDFVLIGLRREFVAQRDGVLFLGVNEGDLMDNHGSYDVVIEAEAGSTTPR